MNKTRSYVMVIGFVIASLILAGCAAPTPAPTPPACPTTEPLSCPTAIVDVPVAPNEWRQAWSDETEVVITFDSGDKCSLDIRKPITETSWFYEIVVNDQAYHNYAVVVMTMDDGKTLKDLQEYDTTNLGGNPPPFAQMKFINIVEPMSSSLNAVELTGKPLYFACIVQGPGDQRVIEDLGPVQLVNQ